VIFINIRIQFVSAKDFGDFDQLVIIIVSVEERFLAEDLYNVSKYDA
jgi:hypothetical protein